MTGPVLVDHREAGSGLPELLQASGLEVELLDLPVGDYVVSPTLAIERKSGGDLTASIKDGRIWDQSARLQEAYAQAVLLVEGDPVGMREVSWRGAVCRLVETGVTVLRSEGMADSARWILRFASRARRPPRSGPLRPLGLRRSPPTLEAQAVAMLAAAPGISTGTAHRLLEHFGSIRAVVDADEAALLEVAGIGPIRARALHDLLTFSPAVPLGPGAPPR